LAVLKAILASILFLVVAFVLTVALTVGLLENSYRADPVLLIGLFFVGLLLAMFGWYFKAARVRWSGLIAIVVSVVGLILRAG